MERVDETAADFEERKKGRMILVKVVKKKNREKGRKRSQ